MNEPPSQEQWDEAFSNSHDLDPSDESWGMFAYSDAPPPVCGSGLGSFHWFHTQDELITFIRDYMSWWNPAPSSLEPEEIAVEVQGIVDAEADLMKMVDHLNEFMRNMWCIEWCGQFQELCEGTDEFPTKIRGSYYDEAQSNKADPVPHDMIEDFKEYLRTYGF